MSGEESPPADGRLDDARLDGAATEAVRSLGGGRWSAAVGNPAGRIVSLRVTGHDRAGATITQTLVRAYAVR